MPPVPAPASPCASIRPLIQEFAEGRLATGRQAELRDHVACCETCRATYVELLCSPGGLGRAVREGEERERVQQAALRSDEASDAPRARRARGLVLGAAAIAALVAVSGIGGGGGRSRSLVLEWGFGAVHLRDRVVGAEPVHLLAGETLETGDAAQASLAAGDERLSVGPRTELVVLDPGVPRLRFERGSITCSGTWELASPWGELSLQRGEAELSTEDAWLQVHVVSGRVVIARSGGAIELAAGETLALDRDGALPGLSL